MLELIAAGKITPSSVVGGTVSLEDTTDVIESMASYETVAMKVMTRF